MKDKRATSDIVTLDYCGPETAHNGFKAMVRENKFDAGELAIVTYLQARACGKPYIALPAPINGRFQHHCAGFQQGARPSRSEGYRRQAGGRADLFADHGAVDSGHPQP